MLSGWHIAESSTTVSGGGDGGSQTNGNTVSATSVTLGGSDFGGSII